jgi:tetratricopeptide (TPR) repeat protein
VNNLLSGLLGALLATNTPLATSNLIQQETGLSVELANTDDPIEREFQGLLELDDEAQAEVDEWILQNNELRATGEQTPDAELNARILRRLDDVRTNYVAFLERHTNHARAYLAYASFLHDIGREPESLPWLEKARDLDPQNAAAWNNLANYYGHYGELTNAFVCYTQAIALNPDEPVYYHNFATTVFLFRKDAREHYGITEQEVFDKALGLYAQALKLTPTDFPLASDVAQCFYGIKPFRTNEAFAAWNYAMSIARDQIERDGVHIHLARLHREIGDYDEARRQLNIITNAMYDKLKSRITRSIADEEAEARGVTPPESESEPAPVPD